MNSSTLSLFSTGTTTGLVIESGHSLTSCVPIFEGFPIQHAFQKNQLAGDEMIKRLQTLLKKRTEISNISLETVKDIKEKMCRVALNYYSEVILYFKRKAK